MSQPNYRINLQFVKRYYYSIKAHLQIDQKSTPFSISDFRCKVIDNKDRQTYCYFVWRDSNNKQIRDDITLCPGKEYYFMIYYSKNNDKEFLCDDILIFNINNQLKFQLNPPPKNIPENNLTSHIPTNELAYKFDNCTATTSTTTTKRSHQNTNESDVDSNKHQQKRSRSTRIIDDEEDEEDEEIVEKKKEKEKDEDEMVEDPFIKAVLKVSTDYRTKLREHQNLRTQLHKTKTRINELTERKNEIKQAFKLVVEEQQQQERILIETDTKINQIMHELTSIKQQFPIPTEPGFNTPVSQTTHEQPIEEDQVSTTAK